MDENAILSRPLLRSPRQTGLRGIIGRLAMGNSVVYRTQYISARARTEKTANSGRPIDAPRISKAASLDFGVFPLGLLQDRDFGIGVFPQGKEIVIGSLCFGRVSR